MGVLERVTRKRIKRTKGRTFLDWDETIVPDLAGKYPHMVGLIAQEVEEVVPEVVYKTMVNSVKDGKEKGRIYKRVLYENLVAHFD